MGIRPLLAIMEQKICLLCRTLPEVFYQIKTAMTGLNQRQAYIVEEKSNIEEVKTKQRTSWHQVFYRCL